MNTHSKAIVCAVAVIVFAGLATPICAQYCTVRPTNVVSWWPFDESTRPWAYDIVSGYDGMYYNYPLPVVGLVDNALQFDGSDDYVRVLATEALNITGDVTVEMWFKLHGVDSYQLVSKGGMLRTPSVDMPTTYCVETNSGGNIVAGFEANNGANFLISAPHPTDGEWHHVAYRRSGNLNEIYLDGALVVGNTASISPGSTSGDDLYIGAIYDYYGIYHYLDGELDELAIYNRALDPSEILAIYNAGSEGFCKEPFTDVTPSVLEDSSERSWGFAWGDYDNDGDHDLYLPTEYSVNSGNKLVRNDGGGAFSDVTPPVLAGDDGYSAAWIDYDNDGDLDLFRAGMMNRLFRNDGSEVFTDVSSGLVNRMGSSSSWGDFDDDGDLDVYVVNFYDGGFYFRNDSGVFTEATSGDLDLVAGYCVIAGDYDNDRDLDLYAPVTHEALLRNDGGGIFVDVTPPGLECVCNTRCASWGDYDNDGDLDIYQGNMMPINIENNLYQNDGGGGFTDVATGPLASTNDTHGVAWGDYDNDGDLDLYLANDGANQLLRNNGGGSFTDVTVGSLGDSGNGREAAWCDYDDDGDLDIFVVNYQGPNKLLRNNLISDTHWLQVDLVGTFSNRSGIGTRIRVVTGGSSQIREVAAGTGARAQGSLTAEFGLGSSTIVDSVEVKWPSGIDMNLADVAADQRILVTEIGISVTVSTEPVGCDVDVDGMTYTAPRSFGSNVGDTYSIGVTSPQVHGDTTFVFSGWSDGGAIVHDVTPTTDTTYTAFFGLFPRILVTVTTEPVGRDVEVDSITYTAPRSFKTNVGDSHSIGVVSPQVHGDTTFVFSGWSDGGAVNHDVAPTTDSTYTALFDLYFPHARVDSIVDVPQDQGGWARVHFGRSTYDQITETTNPITTYAIHRRVDNAALVATIFSDGNAKGGALTRVGDRVFRIVDGPDQAAPPGVWEVLGSIPARQEDQYIYLAPTVADSTDSLTYSVYFVAAHTPTPSVYFDSPPDSGYSVDNIAPGVPPAFFVVYNTGSGNALTWDPVPDNDLQYYKIYRDTDIEFVPAPGNLVDMATSTSWNDPEFDGWQVYYKVTAVDDAGNEGEPTSSDAASGVGDQSTVPEQFALYQNVPNPFNPTTVIRYDVPASGGYVTLKVYDVAGHLLRTLVDGAQTAGVKSIRWNGVSDKGSRVATGIYFYRLTAPGFEQTRKMVLMQ